MKNRFCFVMSLLMISRTLCGQGDPNALVAYLNELRNMNPAQRKAAFDSTEYQRNAARHREIEETVLKPLLTGDLNAYVETLKGGMSDPDPYIRNYTASLIAFAAMNPEVYLIPDSPRVEALAILVPSLIALTSDNESEEIRITALGSLARIVSTRNSSIPAAFK